MENGHIANLNFILNYDDGITQDEIEYEIYKLAFQTRESLHFDRDSGGSFEDIEQENVAAAQVLMINFSSQLIESVYKLNEEKAFDPYIVVGFSDITTEIDGTTMYATISYRLLQDLSTNGTIQMEM